MNDLKEIDLRIENNLIRKQEFKNQISIINLRMIFLRNKIKILTFEYDFIEIEKIIILLKDYEEDKDFVKIKINHLNNFIDEDRKLKNKLLFN